MSRNRLISIFDLAPGEIETIFELTRRIKANPAAYENEFRGRVLGLIFEKPSTRTWISFEVGFSAMGGSAIYLGPNDIQLGVREEVRDVARTLERYLDAVVLRTFSHERIAEFSRYFSKPVINGLSNREHPCQALADFFTMREIFSDLKGRKIAFVGDANNVFHSLLIAAARLGVHFAYATPKPFPPKAGILSRALREAKRTKAKLIGTHHPKEAVRGADVVYTDVWLSMGEEGNSKKLGCFDGFQVNRALMKYAKKETRFMHCLPAHRGEEVSHEIMESRQSIVFDQAENRLHIQKAILYYLLGARR